MARADTATQISGPMITLSDLIPSPVPPAVPRSQCFSLLGTVPLAFRSMRWTGWKYQKHHTTGSSYLALVLEQVLEKQQKMDLPLLRTGFQSQNVTKRSFSPLVFTVLSKSPRVIYGGQHRERRSGQAGPLTCTKAPSHILAPSHIELPR